MTALAVHTGKDLVQKIINSAEWYLRHLGSYRQMMGDYISERVNNVYQATEVIRGCYRTVNSLVFGKRKTQSR